MMVRHRCGDGTERTLLQGALSLRRRGHPKSLSPGDSPGRLASARFDGGLNPRYTIRRASLTPD